MEPSLSEAIIYSPVSRLNTVMPYKEVEQF